MVQIAMRRGNLHLTHKHPRDGEVRGKISARKEATTQDGNPSGLTFREAYLWDVWENYGSRLLVCEFRQAERKFHC
ncbi:MAG: hypothetical protein PHQ43_15555, partial [Dehalococcoidales bacterium]|nr:hypothetical protein [Dehalococcoidales bacterium]